MKKRHLSFLVTLLCQTASVLGMQEGLVYYAGDKLTAYQERYIMAPHRITQPNGDLPEHKGHNIHYAEAFHKNQALIPLTRQAENRGGYRYDGILRDNLHPTIRTQHLIYSDGTNIYQPHVTQELWTRGHGTPTQEDVRFFISSHKDSLKLNRTRGADIDTPNNCLPTGLYQFISAENLTEHVPYNQNSISGVKTSYSRQEKWQKVGSEQFYHIKTPAHHLVSIPGMPEYVVNDFPNEPKDFVDLKAAIETYERTIADNEDLRKPVPRIIFMGDARVGKDALAQYYAGFNLAVNFNKAFRPARIELQGETPLGTLSVVSGIIGSRAAGSWFDQTGQRVIWTTPGANGIEDPLNDILNVLSLKTLLTKNKPSKYVLTIKEADLIETNYKNLNEVLKRMSLMFGYRINDSGIDDTGRNGDLKNALSLVISQAEKYCKDDFVDGTYMDDYEIEQPVKGVLSNILEIMQSSPKNFDAGGMALLEYLANHPERISCFSLPKDGKTIYKPRNPLNTREVVQQSIDVPDGNFSRYMTVENPDDIHISFKKESNDFIQNVLNKLNNQVTKYLSEDGIQKIWNLCNQQILEHEGTVDALRDKLLTFSNKFNDAYTQPLDTVVQEIETLIGVNGITRNMNNIRYLHEKLGVDTNYARDQWLAPLTAVMNNIRYLSAKDLVDGNQSFDALKGINYFFDSQAQELTLVGCLLGLTDVAKFVEKNHTKSGITGIASNVKVRKLNLFSLRNLLADSDLALKEATVIGIAPEILQPVQSITFDLSGRARGTLSKAADNQLGIPGKHGRNGGTLVLFSNNFKDVYKTAHPQDMTKFEIIKDGGPGQNGQEGGNNTSVPTAVEGNTGGWNEGSSHPVSVGHGTWDPEKDRYHVSALKCKGGSDKAREGHHGPFYKDHLSIDYAWKESRQTGIKGTKGNTGKDGGAKGLKGHAGLVEIDCPNINYTTANSPVQVVADGMGGKGSVGGSGGRVNYKITYTYGPGKYNHNGNTEFWANAENGTTILGNGGRERIDGPRLLDSERGLSGEQGDDGVEGGNTVGQLAQTDQITVNQLEVLKDSKLQLYSTYYYNLATDPVKQKLLGKFTNLP